MPRNGAALQPHTNSVEENRNMKRLISIGLAGILTCGLAGSAVADGNFHHGGFGPTCGILYLPCIDRTIA